MHRMHVDDDERLYIVKYGKIIIHGQSTTAFILRYANRTVGMQAHLTWNLMQLPNPEDDPIYESLNTRGCLMAMKAIVNGTLYSSIVLIALLFVLQILRTSSTTNDRSPKADLLPRPLLLLSGNFAMVLQNIYGENAERFAAVTVGPGA
ncbi:hypothetical protein PUN28_001715 [Cardiocondyla obscurior]|uniref:Uncharacterized protein n=1 Tax=Cardiocondyla obscurior TaxID=286306 RepID=A0AAW2GQU8_9HYME